MPTVGKNQTACPENLKKNHPLSLKFYWGEERTGQIINSNRGVINCCGYNLKHRDTKCYCYSLGLLVPVGRYPKDWVGIPGDKALALDLVIVALDESA